MIRTLQPPAASAGASDTVDHRLLLRPQGVENGVVVKAPSDAWSADGSGYGKTQAFMVLRSDDTAAPSTGVLPDDHVVFRVNGKGGVGIGGGCHFGTGLRAVAGDNPQYSIHCNPVATCDVVGIYVDSAKLAPASAYQQWRERDNSVVPNVATVVAEVAANGSVGAYRGVVLRSVDTNSPAVILMARGPTGFEGQVSIAVAGSTVLTGATAGDLIVKAMLAGGRILLGAGNTATTPAVLIGANTLGFHGATPVAKAAVSGSRAANAALASLITALATKGLIIDSTTA